jgi:zinc protease
MVEFNRFKLDNGLTVIHHLDASTPIACMNILYDVGARDEHPENTGFAHLFEHLMFGGSINIENFDEPLQRVGGENNAFTNNDITNYYLTLPVENIETAFWLESDRMLSLAFSEKSLEVQRNVVIEEFKQRYLNQPYGDVWLLLRPLAYKVHPYQWNTIGKEIRHIEEATMDQVKSFFHTHYHPSNAILVVAGNISLDKVKDLSQKWFGPIPGRAKLKRQLPLEPKQNEARVLDVQRKVPSDAIYCCWHMCSRLDKAYHNFDLLSDVLSNGHSSRLYQTLVKEKEIFSEINAYVSGDNDPGLFVISGKPRNGISLELAEQHIMEEVEKIKTILVDDRELQKLKNKAESVFIFSNMNVLNKAMNLAFFEWLGDANGLNVELEKYRNITAENLLETASQFLVDSNKSTLYYRASND